MRILLDEGIPRRLALLLQAWSLDVSAFPNSWKSQSDARLIDRATHEGFSVLITQDRNMPFPTPLKERRVAVLIVPMMDRKAVLANAAAIAGRLSLLEAGRYAVLGREGSLPDPPAKPLL